MSNAPKVAPRPRDAPWFWRWDGKSVDWPGGADRTAESWNDCHTTRTFMETAREGAAYARLEG
jgi:hypothetical protein